MPLLNYTTKVDVYTTLGAIQGQLVKHGAKKIMQDYDDDGHITALAFMVDTPAGPRGIRLPANVDAVHAVLLRQKVKCDRARIGWKPRWRSWRARWCRWMKSSCPICSTTPARLYLSHIATISWHLEEENRERGNWSAFLPSRLLLETGASVSKMHQLRQEPLPS